MTAQLVPRLAGALDEQEAEAGVNGAALLLSCLLDAGVDHFFGVPGGAIEPFLDALDAALGNGKARFVLTRSEAGAGFMADGYFRERGQMAACLSTSGPGATNMLTACASALAEEVPMLFITAQTTLSKFGRNALQESSSDGIDTVGLFSLVAKYSTLVSHPEQLLPKLAKALACAQTPPYGPVHLAFPSDVLKARAGASRADLSLVLRAASGRPVCEAQVQRMAERISAATRPVLWLGEHSEAAAEALKPWLAQSQVPVVVSPAAKTWLPWSYPGFCGVLGYGGHSSARQVLERADALIGIGTGLREMCTEGWNPRLLDHRLLLLTSHAEHLHNAPQAAMAVVGDVGEMAHALVHQHQAFRNAAWPPEALRFSLPALPTVAPNEPVHGARLMSELATRLPVGSRVYADAGNSWAWSIHHLPVNERVNKVQIAMSCGSMGWGLSAAIGAKLGQPTAPVVCLVGDGAWLMSSTEFSTAVAEQLNVVFVLLNDGALGMVKHGQRLNGAARLAHGLPLTDFAAQARALGGHGIRVHNQAELESLDWRALFAVLGPVVVDVQVDADALPPMQVRSKSLQAV